MRRKQQYTSELRRTPLFTRLYAVSAYDVRDTLPLTHAEQALLDLEAEIDEDLPVFHELMLALSSAASASAPAITAEASAARRRLLDAFAQYDALAKRLRALPAPPGGGQDRLQAAVLARASLFLQRKMFPLQVRAPFLAPVCVRH
jgi:rabenosyn-5